MARAVIELSEDISPLISGLGRVVEGFAYNPENGEAAFRWQDRGVILNGRRIDIYGAEDDETVSGFLRWFAEMIDKTG